MTPEQLWSWLPLGYVLTIAIEAPVLVLGLSRAHSLRRRLMSGLWLTACTYPLIVLTLPVVLDPLRDRPSYLLVAETFVPVAECALFALAFHRRSQLALRDRLRDFVVIVAANLASFGAGEALRVLRP